VITANGSTLFELVENNFELMNDGNAEGIVIVSPNVGSNAQITKWKIGSEPNLTNIDFLNQMLIEIEDND
jgi:hypothetical protein